ncbi:MAG: hypothetical protein PF569_04230 [Candidatus Woesearchaeota archaeon]|nr:hypothetical protein [Candidatus Woesearchaeota archaeon]
MVSFSSFSAGESVTCEYKPSCLTGEVKIFHVNDFFKDLSGVEALSSNVATYNYGGYYNEVLCCGSDFGNLSYSVEDVTSSCPDGGVDVLYYASEFNSRVGIAPSRFLISAVSSNPSLQYYTKKLCVDVPDQFSTFDIVASNYDYSRALYTCMFKISDIENGVVSSCDATFDGTNQYEYTVWGRMFESLASLECNLDCTSKLDGRVYSLCSQKVNTCRNVPLSCDGAILESWVVDILDPSREVQCSPTWDNYRSKMFTDDKIVVESAEGECENLIAQKYTVFLNNEPVTMKIYVCSDND